MNLASAKFLALRTASNMMTCSRPMQLIPSEYIVIAVSACKVVSESGSSIKLVKLASATEKRLQDSPSSGWKLPPPSY